MKRFIECLYVAVVLFAYGLFVINPLCQRCVNWYCAATIRDYAEQLGRDARQAELTRNAPEILPAAASDWQIRSMEEWLAEQNRRDIRFTLDE